MSEIPAEPDATYLVERMPLSLDDLLDVWDHVEAAASTVMGIALPRSDWAALKALRSRDWDEPYVPSGPPRFMGAAVAEREALVDVEVWLYGGPHGDDRHPYALQVRAALSGEVVGTVIPWPKTPPTPPT